MARQLHCDRRGVIGISISTPHGNLTLAANSTRKKLQAAVEALGRLAYDNTTWLVPGIPEADSDEEALHAARVFADRVDRFLFERRDECRRTA